MSTITKCDIAIQIKQMLSIHILHRRLKTIKYNNKRGKKTKKKN